MTNRLSRLCEGVMEASWLLALILAPLFFNIYSSRVFEPDKISLVRSLALVAGTAWIIKVLSEGRLRLENVPAPTWQSWLRVPMVVPVTILVVAYLLSTTFSVAPQSTIFGSYQRLQGTFSMFSYIVLAAVLMGTLRQRAQVERLITTVIVTSLPIAFYGVLQRFQLDPLPWGGDTVDRVTANMGNAIFLAAYLIMSAMVTLGRIVQTFHSILTEDDNKNLWSNVLRAAIYILVFALNALAIFWTSSRGPWLGGLAGLFAFFLFLSLYWRVRWLTLSSIGLAAAAGVFLVVLNIPNGPLESLRSVPGIGRLGQVFETEGGTGRVRVLIWNGVVKLMTPHPPLEAPETGADVWNPIRPIIGYGPEALYVAFNRFYPPELGQLEARNASPDRSHNETFDALAFTGLLGLVAYLGLFVSVFYYGLKWQGLITSPGQRNLFLGLILGGGLAGSAGFVYWQGPEFFGVGLPFGMLMGLIVFVTLYALWAMPREATNSGTSNGEITLTKPETWRAIIIIGLFSAILAHFTEIHFGIAIASTRTHFWLFTGLLVVVGYVFPRMANGPEKAAPAKELPSSSRRRLAQREDTRRTTADTPDWFPTFVGAGLLTTILLTLGYDFVTNASRSANAMTILVNSFTQKPVGGQWVDSYAVFGLLGLTWLAGGAALLLEEALHSRSRNPLPILGAGLGVAFFATFIGWYSLAGNLASVLGVQITSPETLLASVRGVAGVMALFYFFMLVLVALLAVVFGYGPGTRATADAQVSIVSLLSYILLPVLTLFLAFKLNVQMVQADIIYKTALQFDDNGQPDVAIITYKEALNQVQLKLGDAITLRDEDYYYLFLGRAYLNATNTQAAQENPQLRNDYLVQAETQLKHARRLNPLNTDHTANLARLNRQWAALYSNDPVVFADRIAQSNGYYQQATSLSPNNAGLWNEWAALAMQMEGDLDRAQGYIDTSAALDGKFDMTYQLQGDIYVGRAQRLPADPAAQKVLYDQAIASYRQGIIAAEARGGSAAPFLSSIAQIYATLGQLPEAITAYNELLNRMAPNDPNQWQVNMQISQWYAQLPTPDFNQALLYAQQALQRTGDETQRQNSQGWIDQLQAVINQVPPPTP